MIIGLGTDLVDLGRFRSVLERRATIRERLFTAAERAYCEERNDPVERYAVRFAAKEATLKALGVGLGAVDWHDIEVRRDDEGRPSLVLGGRAATLATEAGVASWQLSLTHGDAQAVAVAIALSADPEPAGPMSAAAPAGPGVGWLGSGNEDGVPLAPILRGGLVPIVTPAEMAEIDRAAPEPVDVLIGRAGSAVARAARGLLGGTYGRRVVVVAGKGNNGNDGRDAARRLARAGVRTRVIDAADAPAVLPEADLVIDAAYGTGFRGSYDSPRRPPGALVLAVDTPSGVDGLSGGAAGRVLDADVTVTFAALKPGLVLSPGAAHAGRVEVADIGLDVSGARAHLVGQAAVAGWLPERPVDSHKWRSAVWLVAGSPGMGGAASLTARGALRSGAGYVRCSTPGGTAGGLPVEVVQTDLPAEGWADEVLGGLDRFAALVVGNGLGTATSTRAEVRAVVSGAASKGIPTVVDADGLTALGTEVASFVGPTTVLTPHDGEYERLAGHRPGPDRLDAARALAATTGAVVLLKGSSTVVAHPDGRALVTSTGDSRLATAGTGDVLAGVIAALLATGLDPRRAAAAGAFLHGRAGALGWRRGLVAGDVPDHLPAAFEELTALWP